MGFQEVNQGIIDWATGSLSKSFFINAIGWLIFGLVVIGAAGWGAWWYYDRKKYNKKIKVHAIIHGFFHPTYRDVAKSIKIGKGGFEILYLKKAKTWKLAHGARVGINEYSFYILPDGYWYPGQISADLKTIDENNGLVSVVTTNPTMRSQYTSLEKQIDDLHKKKGSFWEKYGTWVLSIAFILIMGVFVWLSFKEVGSFLGSGTELAQTMNDLGETMNKLAVNLKKAQTGGGGLTP